MENAVWATIPEIETPPTDSAESRVIEMIKDKYPHLLMDTPAILGLCAVYYQRKLRGES